MTRIFLRRLRVMGRLKGTRLVLGKGLANIAMAALLALLAGCGPQTDSGSQGEHMVAVENSPGVHNVVVCTLYSCYPWPVLGVPPVWYKSSEYRARVVRDPRGVGNVALFAPEIRGHNVVAGQAGDGGLEVEERLVVDARDDLGRHAVAARGLLDHGQTPGLAHRGGDGLGRAEHLDDHPSGRPRGP